MPELGADIDLCRDLPRYRVFRQGIPVGDPTDISDLWHDDLVAFAIGCSLKVDFVLSTSLKGICGTPGAGIRDIDKPLIAELTPEGRGWFSQNNPFSWDFDKFDYAPDIRRFAGRQTGPAPPQTPASSAEVLGKLLSAGEVRIVDCTAGLGPSTPLLHLPEGLALNTPRVEIHRISEYYSDGPYWAWNWLKLDEHSGTQFDAPHPSLTGRDHADGYTDTLDVRRVVARST